jgi:hypothetical protein
MKRRSKAERREIAELCKRLHASMTPKMILERAAVLKLFSELRRREPPADVLAKN